MKLTVENSQNVLRVSPSEAVDLAHFLNAQLLDNNDDASNDISCPTFEVENQPALRVLMEKVPGEELFFKVLVKGEEEILDVTDDFSSISEYLGDSALQIQIISEEEFTDLAITWEDEEWENEDLEEWEEDQEDLEIDQLQNKEEIDKNDVPFANLEDANL